MRRFALVLLALAASAAWAATPFTGSDFSGTYDCKGNDAAEGAYSGTVTLELVPAHSTGHHGAYRFRLEVPGYGAYPGHAAARNREMAIHFANSDPATADYGTGIASFAKTRSGKWAFTKFYFEPAYKGGNHGSETCVQR